MWHAFSLTTERARRRHPTASPEPTEQKYDKTIVTTPLPQHAHPELPKSCTQTDGTVDPTAAGARAASTVHALAAEQTDVHTGARADGNDFETRLPFLQPCTC